VRSNLAQLSRGFSVKGRVLIVGSRVYPTREDRRELYDDVLGLDMLEGPGVDLVHDLEEPLPDKVGKFDHVDCISVLEHARAPWLVAANIERAMRPGATLYITVPFVWRLHSYPSDYWRFTPQALPVLFPRIKWTELGMVGDKVYGPNEKLNIQKTPHPFLPRCETVGFGVLE
jgi:SAM-dependent methyltransferase